ncbi:MAG: hypothetical protein Q4P78_01380 [Rothia sp. (in: high G+C Gram-positive bacteria)]|uniref:hypothetical protein n=1 Tax=Rothia sp. (in: high G+C Gram-positive bacteria) TaxID=1885016 RepID=UPI0026DFEA04|nr:hypothetical protein [Rothia sp. (in: high G+C Gram-positive bacteria)]MDO5749836.1 hypothetical protein [Rothia sp. (in: high G+C Gram-positive bacteria)]
MLIKNCFTENGAAYEAPGSLRLDGTGREYASWNPEFAAKNGYTQRTPRGNGANPAQFGCEDKAKETLNSIGTVGRVPLARNLEVQARASAKQDPEWNKATKDWISCIRDKGLTIDSDPDILRSHEGEKAIIGDGSPKFSDSPLTEEEIRVAGIEAQCAVDTGAIQKLADLEAAYQLPLIKKNETQLQKDLDDFKENNEKFKKYYLAHQ